jgi:ATP-binding cassette subfamily B protein
MSAEKTTADAPAPQTGTTTTARRPPVRRGPGGGGPMGGMGMPGEKSLDFKASLRRLVGVLRPERWWLSLVVLLGIVSVALSVTGPKILGNATNVIFEGVIGKMLPAGVTQEQAVAGLRADGQGKLADMLSGMQVVPGQGVDFDRLHTLLLWVVAIYVVSALFSWVQGLITTGAVQRVVRSMRAEVEAKLGRLPLKYFDGQPRGEVLSRVTNDIDNVAQTLQQTMSQLITSVLTVVGVLAMMFWISPLLAVVALVTIPLSIFVTTAIAKRSQPQFVQQWKVTGTLNAHIEEMYTGHALVKVFGRQRQAVQEFHDQNADLYQASFKAQFISDRSASVTCRRSSSTRGSSPSRSPRSPR